MAEQEAAEITENVCLLMSLENNLYAMNALHVEEILELPALQCIGGLPCYIAGFVNIRGNIITVLNLRICLGAAFDNYSILDHLIIVKGKNGLFGLVTSEVMDLIHLNIEKTSSEKMLNKITPICPFIEGVAKFEEQIVFLIDVLALENHILEVSPGIFKIEKIASQDHKACAMPINPDEQTVFQERAKKLVNAIISSTQPEQTTLLTVILLKQEYYAIDTIKEFCPISEFTIIPCSPPFLFGFFNLRGHVLPIIDIWQLLQGEKNSIRETSKVLVVDFEGTTVGILVDDVLNLIFSSAADYRTVPLSIKVISEAFVKSTVKYEKEVIPILDMPKILKSIQSQS